MNEKCIQERKHIENLQASRRVFRKVHVPNMGKFNKVDPEMLGF
jgi:hypothetical protein